MNLSKLLKLAKAIAKFESIKTDNGELTYNGDLVVGAEVFIGDEVAPDGTYTDETGTQYVVAEGKIVEINQPETVEVEVAPEEEVELEDVVEETPVEEAPDEKDAQIAELESIIEVQKDEIENLKARIAELEDAAKAPVEEAVALKAVVRPSAGENGALKFFKD